MVGRADMLTTFLMLISFLLLVASAVFVFNAEYMKAIYFAVACCAGTLWALFLMLYDLLS